MNKIHILNKINDSLTVFLQDKKIQAEKYGDEAYREIVEQVCSLTMLGRDRIRPLLVFCGYKLISKNNTISDNDVLQISLAVEMFHTACLIHDDIMDNSKERRGKPTLLEFFYQKYQNLDLARNLAILAGDLTLIWADEIFFSTKIDQKIVLKTKPYFDFLREEVIFGQSLDLKSENKTKEEILKIAEYKTAKYSFERPLQIGAVLAGADTKTLKILSDFAVNIGMAFQIQDDILGVFGDSKNTGKDSDGDIREGKNTLLILNLKFSIFNEFKKNKFKKIFGNKNATKEEIEWVRDLIINTNALDETQKTAKKLVEEGKKAMVGYNRKTDYQAKEFLLELAEYCIGRKD